MPCKHHTAGTSIDNDIEIGFNLFRVKLIFCEKLSFPASKCPENMRCLIQIKNFCTFLDVRTILHKSPSEDLWFMIYGKDSFSNHPYIHIMMLNFAHLSPISLMQHNTVT